MSPGPIYDKPPAIESRPAGIGLRPKTKVDRKGGLPGPADYFKTPIPPKELPFCGLYGPTERLDLHLDRQKDEPGPAYKLKGQFEGRRSGFAFGSRKMTDYVPDSDGSFQPQFSGLAGPKWTIGVKDA
jgi:hypothetical protein